MRSILLYIFAAIFLSSTTLRARFMPDVPVFNMDGDVDEARLIVRGFLDEEGNIQVQEIYKGEHPTNVLTVADGEKTYQWLSAPNKNDPIQSTNKIEVVAFLSGQTKDRYQLLSGYAGIVELKGTNVYLCGYDYPHEGFFRERLIDCQTLIRDEHFTRESFLSALIEQVTLCNRRDMLLTMPRSAERARKLISFFLEHHDKNNRMQIAAWLRPINPDEQKEILREIDDTEDIGTRCFLIGLAGDIPLSKDAFESLAPLIDLQTPRQVRRAAMIAATCIDAHEAAKHVLPLLHTSEPDLDEALMCLETPPTDIPPDVNTVDALLALSKEIKKQDAAGAPPISHEAQQALAQQLAEYVHPKLISFYFNWPLNRKPRCPDYVTSYLQAMLGVSWTSEQLEMWWKQQRKYIEADFNVGKSRDQARWFDAYQSADVVAKRFLVRFWMFTTPTNQLALVKAATEEKTATTAKAVISGLWNGGQLSNAAKKAMFENFLKVNFFVHTNLDGIKNYHGFYITGTTYFVFNTWINFRYSYAVDGKQVVKSSYQDGIELDKIIGDFYLGGAQGLYPGRIATALLELHQVDHYGNELWHAQWDLGPLRLP